jgi:hypothetical protein
MKNPCLEEEKLRNGLRNSVTKPPYCVWLVDYEVIWRKEFNSEQRIYTELVAHLPKERSCATKEGFFSRWVEFKTHLYRSRIVGSLLSESISSWIFLWTWGYLIKYNTEKLRELLVVSDPAMNKSSRSTRSWSSGNQITSFTSPGKLDFYFGKICNKDFSSSKASVCNLESWIKSPLKYTVQEQKNNPWSNSVLILKAILVHKKPTLRLECRGKHH